MLSQMFVFHKSKNFTSDNGIRMPPTVPLNHYSGPTDQHDRPESCRVIPCYYIQSVGLL
uniref:Cytochrome p450 liketbp n=1 Tax=Tetraselmis sp. GSL018 TaxID=582737 RepID=A0A061S8Z6_9CHLO